jgi:hypothetical protein
MGSLTEGELSRLRGAMKWSRDQLAPFRKNHLEGIEQYVGSHYSKFGAKRHVPINLLALFVNVYTRLLTARNPKALVGTPYKGLNRSAHLMKMALNYLTQSMALKDTMRGGVKSAMFSFGVFKMGLGREKELEIGGESHWLVRPFVDQVDVDNWVHDMNATRWSGCQFYGDRYQVRYKDLPPEFQKEETKKWKYNPTETSDLDSGQKRASKLSQGEGGAASGGDRFFEDTVELWDIFIPSENKVLTVPDRDERTVINEMFWSGPKAGPYLRMSFNDVPDQVMPSAPVNLIRDLHDSVNRVYRKVVSQVERQKSVLLVRGSASKDGSRILKSEDGDIITSDDPAGSVPAQFGGLNQGNLGFVVDAINRFSWISGNIDAIGGLSPQSGTLGQDQLLSQAANQVIEDMQACVMDVVREILRGLAL